MGFTGSVVLVMMPGEKEEATRVNIMSGLRQSPWLLLLTPGGQPHRMWNVTSASHWRGIVTVEGGRVMCFMAAGFLEEVALGLTQGQFPAQLKQGELLEACGNRTEPVAKLRRKNKAQPAALVQPVGAAPPPHTFHRSLGGS